MANTTAPVCPVSFDYLPAKVRDLRPTLGKKGAKVVVEHFTIDGRQVEPTQRFWTSLSALYGFAPSIFKWFEHAEVFERISERATTPSDKLRLCIETKDGKARLLGASQPSKIVVKQNDLLDLLREKGGLDTSRVDYGSRLGRHGHHAGQALQPAQGHNQPHLPLSLRPLGVGHNDIITSTGPGGDGGAASLADVPVISYDTGVIRSIHAPRNDGGIQIAGDVFSNRFCMDTPIDGYGKPSIYLMLLRQICTNGAIGYARAFRSDISLGKKEDSFEYALTRAFEGYNNEDGFQALQERYEAAAHSWCSIAECNRVYKCLVKAHHKAQLAVSEKYLQAGKSGADGAALTEGSPIIQSFHRLTGDLTQAYGLANLDALSIKRQRTLPAGCKMYEMLNFITEVATHHALPSGARELQAITGDLLSAEYDLEGTADKFGDWKDFLVLDANAAEFYAIAQKQ